LTFSLLIITLFFKVLFMKDSNPIQDLQEIRKMMEDSSKFLSLSGLSGVFAGTIALIGAGLAYWRITSFFKLTLHYSASGQIEEQLGRLDLHLFLLALAILVTAVGGGVFFTWIKAKKEGKKLFTRLSFRLVRSLMVPLVFAGIFIIGLYYQGYFNLIAPAMLVFYGMALLNASKYVHEDIKYLALCQMTLGTSLIFFQVPGLGLLFWAIGFGVLHIVYGAIMYYKYDRK